MGAEERPTRVEPVAGVAETDGAVIVRLAGELDLHNASTVRKALLDGAERRPDRLVVDLSEVTFVDSTMLGVLVEARAHMRDRKTFLLAAPGLETRRALEISGLDRAFAVHDSLEDALGAKL